MGSNKCMLQLLALAALVLLAGVSEGGAVRRQLVGASSPKSTWQNYWDAKFPGVPPPASLTPLSSHLTAADTTMYVNKLTSAQVSDAHFDCNRANFLCAQRLHPTQQCTISFSYSYGCKRSPDSAAAPASMMMPALFFRPDTLSPGKNIVYPKLDNDLQGRTFLPAELANAMPFSPEKLPRYLALLGVPSGSNMAANMQQTLAFCANSKPLPGEILACHSSIESMIDFSVSNLGSKVTLLSPAYTASASEEVRVKSDPVTLSSPDKKSITCHDHMYPYLVYSCHVMASSRILDVELQRVDGSSFHGMSVCHTDTTSWDPDHPAFAALNAHPGDGTLCHWVPRNNFAWIET